MIGNGDDIGGWEELDDIYIWWDGGTQAVDIISGILGMANIPIYRRLSTYQSPSNHSHPSSQFYPPSFPKLLAAHQPVHGSLYPSSPFCELFINPVLELSKLIFYWSSQSSSHFGAPRAHVILRPSKLISYRSSRSSYHFAACGAHSLSDLSELAEVI